MSKTIAPSKGLNMVCLEGEAPQFVLSSLVHEEVIRLCTVRIHSTYVHAFTLLYVCTVCNICCLIIAAGALCIIIL